MALDKELLTLLVCPTCKGPISLCPGEDGLLCTPCQRVYPIKDEIPVMLTDEAVSTEDWQGSK